MEKSKSSKKDRLEKLRISLQSNSGEKLHPEDEKYLKVLHSRLSKTSKENKVNIYRESRKTDEKSDSLKPQVTIHQKEEEVVETPIFTQPESEKVEVKEEIGDKDLFEVKKVEVSGPEFIEVKPKETVKKAEFSEKKITQKIEEPEQKDYEKLPEWEPVETKNVEQLEKEVKIEEKTEPKEEIVESFVLEEELEEFKDDKKLKKLEMKKAKKDAKEKEQELKKKVKVEEKKKKLGAKMALKEEKKPEVEDEEISEFESLDSEFEEEKPVVGEKPVEEKSETEFEEIKEPTDFESSDIKSNEFETTEEEKKPENEESLFFEEKKQLIFEERNKKLDVFKDIICIDGKTANLLYDNGFTSIDDLKIASVKDLSRIKGIKRKLAKKIKKELEELELPKESKDLVKAEESSESFVVEEEFVPEEEFMEDEKMFFEEDKEQTLPDKKDESMKIFKDIKSIDSKTSSVLVENGIASVDILKETPVKNLAKIDGIGKKLAKKIKKELKRREKKSKKTAFSIAEVYDKDVSKDFEEPIQQIVEEKEKPIEAKKIVKRKPRKKQKSKHYKHGSYTLYKKDIKTKSKKSKKKSKKEVYFFSRQKRNKAEPSDLPKGFEVRINRKTGVPYLRKKK